MLRVRRTTSRFSKHSRGTSTCVRKRSSEPESTPTTSFSDAWCRFHSWNQPNKQCPIGWPFRASKNCCPEDIQVSILCARESCRARRSSTRLNAWGFTTVSPMVDTSRAPAHADRAKSTSLTVAINSQINPRTAGGVETALNALNAQLGRLDASAKFLLLALDRYADEIARCAGPNQRVEVWPFGQRGYEPPPTPGRRWLRARQRAGRFAPLVDFACAARHRLARRPPGNPSASQTDPFLRRRGVSVVHFPYGLRFGTSLPFVYEPWDLQHRHHPEFFSRAEWQWREEMYRASCLSATHVVTATRWTKNDIVAQYGLDPEKVVVIPRGPSAMPPRLSRAQQAAARADLDLPDSFAFFPAMTFPHKNHILLLEALAELRDQHGVVLPLLCSGRLYKPHWPKVAAAVERLQLNG